jgi:hypothetical protein
MQHIARVVASGTAVFAFASGCASSSAPAPRPTAATSTPRADAVVTNRAHFAACQDARFVTKLVQGVSPQTGEHGVIVQFVYLGSTPCALRGYPTVALLASNRTSIPFDYRDAGGPYLTHRAPRTLELRPEDSVVAAIAKYRCDTKPTRTATQVLFTLPDSHQRLDAALDQGSVEGLDYCPAEISRTIYISPFEATESQLYRHRHARSAPQPQKAEVTVNPSTGLPRVGAPRSLPSDGAREPVAK